MKKLIKTLTLITVLLGATAAYAIPSTGSAFIEKTPYSANGGGEFLVTVPGEDPFYTFCVERNQSLTAYLDGTFNYEVASSTSSTGNVMSKGTVHLYRMFLAGTLYDLGGADRQANSIKLQYAIWTLEGEGSGLGQTILNNAWLAIANGVYGAGMTDDSTDTTVRVMRIWGQEQGDDKDYQDLIVYVPDSGASMALLGMALVVLAIGRRKFAK